MNKQELLDKLSLCIKHCEKMGSQDGQAAYYGAYSLAVQLDEPSPPEGCEKIYCKTYDLKKYKALIVLNAAHGKLICLTQGFAHFAAGVSKRRKQNDNRVS